MQVILTENVDKVGKKGQSLKVADGYARNFLFPKSLAIPFKPGNAKHIELMKNSWSRKEKKEAEQLRATAKKLDALSIRITKKAGDKGRLFGSVTTSELAELIGKESGVHIDKKSIVSDHLKELGQHEVVIKFSGEVKSTVKVLVLPEETVSRA